MLVLKQRGGGGYLDRILAREGWWRNGGLLGQWSVLRGMTRTLGISVNEGFPVNSAMTYHDSRTARGSYLEPCRPRELCLVV